MVSMRNASHGERTMKNSLKILSLPLCLSFALMLVAALATNVAAQSDDPPSRVARLDMAQGAVSFQPSGETDWLDANPNRPLTTGDSVWADQNSRGELHLGSTSMRIGSQTGITFLNLNDRTVQIQLAQGTFEITLRQLDPGDAYEIDTPNVAFSLVNPGTYRLDVDPDGQTTTIIVRDGAGEVTGGGSSYNLSAGQRAAFSGTDTLSYDISRAGSPDDFDAWCQERDQREDDSVSAKYVSRGMTGYEALDQNGDWVSVPDYGMVWVPSRVDAGWAPYRYGHWVWIEPWGWTWVDNEPWGFAPFHYGRWAYVEDRWAWVPGPMVVHPVYAPALVVFVSGGGFHAGVGVGGGPVGWFPLGPREVYVPAYHCSPRYVQYVNVTNTRVENSYVTNVYNDYRRNPNGENVRYANRDVRNSVTVVDHETFVNARPVAPAMMKVQPEELRQAHVMQTSSIAPTRTSYVGASPVSRVRPPAAVIHRPVVARLPAPPPPVPFERKQPDLAAQPGHPVAPEKIEQLRKPQEEYQQPTVKYAPPAHVNRPEPHAQPKPPKAPKPQKPQKSQKPGKPEKPGR
jgi:Family of unknown function (DUF6600)